MADAIPQPQPGTLQIAEHSGTQEAGGAAFKATDHNPLTQAGANASTIPSNVPSFDPLRPDAALQSGHDASAQKVEIEDPQAGQEVAAVPPTGNKPVSQVKGQVTEGDRQHLRDQHNTKEKAKGSPSPEDGSPADDMTQGEAVPQDEKQPSGGDETQDEFGGDPNSKTQPKSEAPKPVMPPITQSVKDIPTKLVTSRDRVLGNDPDLNKHRA